MTVIRGRSPSENFYPRPPRGGRLGVYYGVGKCKGISIHALREEGDADVLEGVDGVRNISIHALREEGDGDGRRRV